MSAEYKSIQSIREGAKAGHDGAGRGAALDEHVASGAFEASGGVLSVAHERLRTPQSFCSAKNAREDAALQVGGVDLLRPHARFTAEDELLLRRILDDGIELVVIKVNPCVDPLLLLLLLFHR
jgi:hypothetical protein